MASGIANVRFVGRGEELRALAAAYAEAEAGGASLVVVGGDAGVGKTRLLAEFTGGLDAMVLPGGCLPLGATGMPFSPIVEVLRRLTGDGAWPDRLPPALARLVPGLPADPSPPPSSQAELFQAFLGLLERLAADQTVRPGPGGPPLGRPLDPAATDVRGPRPAVPAAARRGHLPGRRSAPPASPAAAPGRAAPQPAQPADRAGAVRARRGGRVPGRGRRPRP